MSTGTPLGGGPQRIRANRKVVETPCVACGLSFTFGEEVCACHVCGKYHHVHCWDDAKGCLHGPASASPPLPAVATQSERLESDESGAVTPMAVSVTAASAPTSTTVSIAADEQFCSQCGKVIKADALKCRFCGFVISPELASQEIPASVIADINKQASSALKCGIGGFFICAPILGTSAIKNGNAALRMMDQYPQYQGPRGKARAGVILGWVGWALLILGILARIASQQ